MDLAVPTGTPIRAALPGTVTVSTYNQGGYGYYIMIDHGNGLSTLYGHCSQLLASVGRTVKAGDVIAPGPAPPGVPRAPTSTSRCASTASGQTPAAICHRAEERKSQ